MTPAPPLPVPGLSPGWEPEQADSTPAPPARPQTAGERVLARICALGDDEPSEDYRRALTDVLKVLMDCAPDCHEGGHR